MHIWPFLAPNAEAAKLIQPCEGTFHKPAPLPESTTMFRIAKCEPRQDVAPTQGTPNVLGIVRSVAQ